MNVPGWWCGEGRLGDQHHAAPMAGDRAVEWSQTSGEADMRTKRGPSELKVALPFKLGAESLMYMVKLGCPRGVLCDGEALVRSVQRTRRVH